MSQQSIQCINYRINYTTTNNNNNNNDNIVLAQLSYLQFYTGCFVIIHWIQDGYIFINTHLYVDPCIKFGTNPEMPSLSFMVSWSKLAALCVAT